MISGFTADGLFPTFNTMDEVFGFTWSNDTMKMEKAKGTGTVGITTDGTMNAIYGPFMQNLAYNKHNTLAALGQKPYQTARRFQEGLSKAYGSSSGLVRGGFAPQAVFGDYLQFEMPYKVLAHRFAMNIGMTEIGEKGIDDVMTWKQQVEFEGDTWLNSINSDVLRRIEDPQPTGVGSVAPGSSDSPSGEFVGMESIERIISNSAEGGALPSTYNVPWRMAVQMPSTDSNMPLNKYRNPSASDFKANNNVNAYVDSNYNSGTATGEATLRQLTLPMIDNLFLSCMPYWEANSTRGKALISGYDTVGKIQMILQPQQRYQGYVSAQVDVNGVKTVEGQNTGFNVATYMGTPILPDLMVQKGYGPTTGGHADDGVSRMYLTDSDTMFVGQLRAPAVEISQNPIITGRYIRLCDMSQYGEVQVAGMFRGLGKIIHLK